MTEVGFHKELYDGEAVDEAAKTYDRFATLERVDEGHRWLVRVSAKTPEREARIADELANFALGVTVERTNGARAKSLAEWGRGRALPDTLPIGQRAAIGSSATTAAPAIT